VALLPPPPPDGKGGGGGGKHGGLTAKDRSEMLGETMLPVRARPAGNILKRQLATRFVL